MTGSSLRTLNISWTRPVAGRRLRSERLSRSPILLLRSLWGHSGRSPGVRRQEQGKKQGLTRLAEKSLLNSGATQAVEVARAVVRRDVSMSDVSEEVAIASLLVEM